MPRCLLCPGGRHGVRRLLLPCGGGPGQDGGREEGAPAQLAASARAQLLDCGSSRPALPAVGHAPASLPDSRHHLQVSSCSWALCLLPASGRALPATRSCTPFPEAHPAPPPHHTTPTPTPHTQHVHPLHHHQAHTRSPPAHPCLRCRCMLTWTRAWPRWRWRLPPRWTPLRRCSRWQRPSRCGACLLGRRQGCAHAGLQGCGERLRRRRWLGSGDQGCQRRRWLAPQKAGGVAGLRRPVSRNCSGVCSSSHQPDLHGRALVAGLRWLWQINDLLGWMRGQAGQGAPRARVLRHLRQTSALPALLPAGTGL